MTREDSTDPRERETESVIDRNSGREKEMHAIYIYTHIKDIEDVNVYI